MHHPGPSLEYRAEIDGLRALAVLPVIFFHAGFEIFKGGYVGVDIFFVISGYLITSIIQSEIGNHSFSIIKFYERRARRIIPALVLVAIVSIPFAWMWMLASELKDFGQSVISVGLFSSNILFWLETGYFEAPAETKPLLHTWSLAIEEQFYIFFPLVLLMLRHASRQRRLVTIATLTVVSLALAEWGGRVAPSATFYLLPTRAWELGIGALVALSAPSWSRVHAFVSETTSAIGLALILFAVFAFDSTTSFPSLAGLVPVLGTAAVIIFATPATVVGRLLGLRAFVGIGLISYSAYLWHQPILVFARTRLSGGEIAPLMYGILILLTLVLAFVTWKFVELPFRRRALIGRNQIFMGTGLAGCVLLAIGVFFHMTNGLPGRQPEIQAFARWFRDMSPNPLKCRIASASRALTDPECIYGKGDGDPLDIWGDSHGVELAWQLTSRLEPYRLRVREIIHAGCIPIDGHEAAHEGRTCVSYRSRVFDHLHGVQSSAPLIIVGRWGWEFDPKPFDNGEGGREPGGAPITLSRERIDEIGRQLRTTIQTFLEAGRRVVLVYPIPEVGWHVPNQIRRLILFHSPREKPLSTSYQVYRARVQAAVEQLDSVPTHPNLIRVRPSDILCNTFLPDRCSAEVDGAPLYYDYTHLNSVGGGLLSDAIVDQMARRGWLGQPISGRVSR